MTAKAKEKAIQIFDEQELILTGDDKWITVRTVKEASLRVVGRILKKYRNSATYGNGDNASRIYFWQEVGLEISKLYS